MADAVNDDSKNNKKKKKTIKVHKLPQPTSADSVSPKEK